ncbi:sodium:solute symporter family protein [Candidatus Methanocrinis natronophilus]|uniref:Sodium:solute symporter family protein n=1 Tax=Candidatus Methanocrinis natronophilus TaxID=3033396 RepID=A0ABT5X9S6_9EURY|nr:sodium:solute symporter family protein [Candidatus Methanocrinis natronophilus]MDF0591450.1 sodium:solute symporter family protein [Candidatus Methanocrinis natronophilus]
MVDDSWIVALVVAGYLLLMIWVGAASARRSQTIESFFLAGRNLSPAVLTATLTATILGASSTLGMAGLGFREGLTGAWWLLSGALGLLVLSIFFAEKVRSAGCYTLPELLGERYDPRVRYGASALILISWVGIISAQIVASGKLLGVLFGPGQEVFMVVSALVFVGYTALGGQRSIVKTDAVQISILLLGLLVVAWRAFHLAGPDEILAAGGSFPTSQARGGIDVMVLVLVVGSTYIAGPDIYSRLFSAKDPKAARASAFAAALLLIPIAFIITGLGISARILFPGIGPEEALPVLISETLSPLGEGLLAAALLSALISSADTTLLTATSILSLDLFRRARPESSERTMMIVSRGGTVLIGGVALLSALRLPEIIGALLSAYTVFAGGLIVPLVAGFWRERLRLTSGGALAALLGGGGTAILFGAEMPLLGMMVSAALLFSVSWLSPQSRRLIRG